MCSRSTWRRSVSPPARSVAGNLPYNISSPILFLLLETQRRLNLFADATLMLQKEVADRLVAVAGHRRLRAAHDIHRPRTPASGGC